MFVCLYVYANVEENCTLAAYAEFIFGQMTGAAHDRNNTLSACDTYVTTTPVGYQFLGTKSLAPRQAGWLADHSLALLLNPSCTAAA